MPRACPVPLHLLGETLPNREIIQVSLWLCVSLHHRRFSWDKYAYPQLWLLAALVFSNTSCFIFYRFRSKTKSDVGDDYQSVEDEVNEYCFLYQTVNFNRPDKHQNQDPLRACTEQNKLHKTPWDTLFCSAWVKVLWVNIHQYRTYDE